MNGNMGIAVIGLLGGLLFGGAGATAIGYTFTSKLAEETKKERASITDKVDENYEKFESFIANEFQERVREEHRLTKIEEAIAKTNELLEEIKRELQKE